MPLDRSHRVIRCRHDRGDESSGNLAGQARLAHVVALAGPVRHGSSKRPGSPRCCGCRRRCGPAPRHAGVVVRDVEGAVPLHGRPDHALESSLRHNGDDVAPPSPADATPGSNLAPGTAWRRMFAWGVRVRWTRSRARCCGRRRGTRASRWATTWSSTARSPRNEVDSKHRVRGRLILAQPPGAGHRRAVAETTEPSGFAAPVMPIGITGTAIGPAGSPEHLRLNAVASTSVAGRTGVLRRTFIPCRLGEVRPGYPSAARCRSAIRRPLCVIPAVPGGRTRNVDRSMSRLLCALRHWSNLSGCSLQTTPSGPLCRSGGTCAWLRRF